jgi:adenosylcobinamide kinase/adenosylcobinamide-phosphate guanylyltransferase
MGALTYITGGARSGKSRFAEDLAAREGRPVTYLATMAAGDDELRARIAVHRARRPAAWRTIEEGLELAAAITAVSPGDLVLLDCVSLWVSNLLFAHVGDPDALTPGEYEALVDRCLRDAREWLETARRRPGPLVAVSNEVGSGIVPVGALSRCYRDALGLVNQAIAAEADSVYLLVSGIPVTLK